MSIIESADIAPEASAGFDIPVDLCILDCANRVVAARIRSVSPSCFELVSQEALQEGQRLALSHEGRRIQVAVSSTTPIASGIYLLTVKVVEDELGEARSELRLPTDLPAVLRIAGGAEQMKARVVNMSLSGMGIELQAALPLGSKVCVNIEQGLAFGEIRFCHQKSSGIFFVGFLLEEYIGQEWSA